ncbi:MAG: hypothetical protein ACJ8C6_08485, partial [Microvirga sp.]
AMDGDGHPVTPALDSCLSPYTREHIRRFGQYVLDMADLPPRSIRNHCRSRKPERAHRYSNSHASPDPAVIQLVGAFRAYPQLTS